MSKQKKTGRAEALPVSLTKLLQPDVSLSDRRRLGPWGKRSTAWWLGAFWPSSELSLPCFSFLLVCCVRVVSLTKNLQPDCTLSERETTAWWLRASLPFSVLSSPCFSFLQVRFCVRMIGGRETLCILLAKACQQIADLLCPYNSHTCAPAPVRTGDRTGGLGVELINAGMNCSTGLFSATSWPLPQARLFYLPGSTYRRPGSPVLDLGGPRLLKQRLPA